jgi:hypothetical protein
MLVFAASFYFVFNALCISGVNVINCSLRPLEIFIITYGIYADYSDSQADLVIL